MAPSRSGISNGVPSASSSSSGPAPTRSSHQRSHSPSHSSANSTSSSGTRSPAQSDLHLPPNTSSSEYYYEGDVPNVLADRVLQLHAHSGSHGFAVDHHQPRNGHGRESWFAGLTRSRSDRKDTSEDEATGNRDSKDFDEDESEGLLASDDQDRGEPSSDGEEQDDDRDDHRDSEQHTNASSNRRPKRSSRSRSKSIVRRLPWYRRPSPWFFMPGTLVMALSIGMTISPKIEIYFQLVCRSIGPEKSGVTLPPPLIDLGGRQPGPVVSPAHGSSRDEVHDFVTKAIRTQAKELHFMNVNAYGDDSWAKQCHKSVAVQQGVASLATLLSLIMGILSALTTGFYGSLSDRRGRKPVLVLAMFGSIMMDTVVLFTVRYHDIVGYRFLLVGPLIDGLLGGMTTAQATSNAYLADCTDAGSRARIFSVLGGIMFGGIAIGPTIGALLVRQTGSTILPFYVALAMHVTYALVMFAIFPESLSQSRQLAARKRHAEEHNARRAAEEEEARQAKADGVAMVWLLRSRRWALRPWRFLKPLGLLVPRNRDPNEKEEDRPLLDALGPVRAGRDFSLVKIAVGMGCFSICIAIYQVKLLYTSKRFGWGSEENGLYLSFIGACRVIVLIIVLPLFIRVMRKPAPLPRRPRPERELDTAGPTELTSEQKEWDREAKWLRTVHDSHFDLFLARISLLVDMFGYTLVALNGGSSGWFLFATVCSSFGGGAGPAIQSLALAHASPRDSGRLFASLSVLSSVGGQIIGPLLFGTVYIATVKELPETVFWILVMLLGLSLSALLTVRLRKKVNGVEDVLDREQIRTSDDLGVRGRSVTRRVDSTNGSAIEL